MGFDITAIDDEGKEVSYHRAYMGGFRMMREQGYDWFALIDASDMDCGVSGCGGTKNIKLQDLKHALKELVNFEVTILSSEGRNEVEDRRYRLVGFMNDCILWCISNEKEEIEIHFC